MKFSNRDKNPIECALKNQRGQAIVEYILILVATVGLILGGIYQLNSAFKAWANNYFGNYLACLLETGELPTISGGGGNGGLCNEIFKPFSLAEGRPLVSNYKAPEGTSTSSSRSRGSREGSRSAGGGGGYSGGGGRFTAGRSKSSSPSSAGGGGKKSSTLTNTGNIKPSDYGVSGRTTYRRQDAGIRTRLDNRVAFENEQDRPLKRSVAGWAKPPGEGNGKSPRIRLKKTDLKKKQGPEADTSLTLPNFLRFLVIAGIIIALIVFLGGQGLQIGKSME